MPHEFPSAAKSRDRLLSSKFDVRCLLILLSCALLLGAHAATYQPSSISPPKPVREFRAAWVATVANIDWPSRKDLATAEQKTELLAILDRAQRLKLNTVILLVTRCMRRPSNRGRSI